MEDAISSDEEPKSIIYITSDDDDADEVTKPVADNINTEHHQPVCIRFEN